MASDFRMPPVRCPRCGRELDGALNVEGDDAPDPGDFTVCFGCEGVLRWTETLELEACDHVPEPYRAQLELAVELLRRAKAMAGRPLA